MRRGPIWARQIDLLATRGDSEGLQEGIDLGDSYATGLLADAFARLGRGEEAERLRRFGLNRMG